MQTTTSLLKKRYFLPLFITQFLGAFNDNLFRTAMVMLVIYSIYDDPAREAQFSTIAQGLFILPFFLLSAISGQLADSHDKAGLIRMVKTAEIIIMIFGAAGLIMHSVPLMLAALFAMGVHSTFFGPIKYAILPQHLDEGDVLGGTGLVEAGTYIAILLGTICGGWGQQLVRDGSVPDWTMGAAVIGVAIIGRIAGHFVPPAPAGEGARDLKIDLNIFTASWRLIGDVMHVRRIRLAIICISFFWSVGALLGAQFPPLVKNALHADESVATAFLAIFSIGIAIGSIAANRLLKGTVSAKYSPISAIFMGLFVLLLWYAVESWAPSTGPLYDFRTFITYPLADFVMLALLGIAIFGGMFVVPLYAYLTVTVAKTETARTIAVNNIINSGFMVVASLSLGVLIGVGATIEGTLLYVAFACLVSAWIARRLHQATDPALAL